MTERTKELAKAEPRYLPALTDLLYQLADDDLCIGHRASEWLGVAPEIEEDVAFSSISQDEVGHAAFYYQLLADLGEGHADALAFERLAESRRNAVFVERENGDWAHTIARHYFYDVFEDVRLQALEQSSYLPLRQGAVKIRREEFYHLLHHETWFRRLAAAGGEARRRLESALGELWRDVPGLFDLGPHADLLVLEQILPHGAQELFSRWRHRIGAVLAEAGLEMPDIVLGAASRAEHTEALTSLLETMGEVHNIDRAASW